MQTQHSKSADHASRRTRRGHLSRLLLIGSDEAFNREFTRRILSGHQFRIVGRSTTLLDALARLESGAIDLVLLSREFREEELALFALDAHRRGFAGLILRDASLAGEMTAATSGGSRGIPDEPLGLRSWRGTADALSRLELQDQHGILIFTAKQQAVLTRVSEGWTNQQIAHHLRCSEGSVKAVLQELFRKLGVRKRAQIVRMAFENTLWNPASGIRPGTTPLSHGSRQSGS